MARDDQKSPEAHRAMKARMDRQAVTSLTVQVKEWPTPQAAEGHKLGGMTLETAQRRERAGFQMTLNAAAQLHGPPAATTTTDGDTGSPKVDLNPRFVEALMGVPQNWLTPSTSVETDSYQQWLRLHSLSSPADSTSTCGGTHED